jgi:hypothetical protein
MGNMVCRVCKREYSPVPEDLKAKAGESNVYDTCSECRGREHRGSITLVNSALPNLVRTEVVSLFQTCNRINQRQIDEHFSEGKSPRVVPHKRRLRLETPGES